MKPLGFFCCQFQVSAPVDRMKKILYWQSRKGGKKIENAMLTHVVHAFRGCPAKHFFRKTSVRVTSSNVSWTTSHYFERDYFSGSLLERVYHFEHRVPFSCSQVYRIEANRSLRFLIDYGFHVPQSEICYVNIISNACSRKTTSIKHIFSSIFLILSISSNLFRIISEGRRPLSYKMKNTQKINENEENYQFHREYRNHFRKLAKVLSSQQQPGQ